MNKRYQLIFASLSLLCLLALPVHAQMFSLWGDESMTACEFFTQASYVAYTVCLVLEPGSTGVFGAEYMLTLLPDHILQVLTPSPLIAAATGNATGTPGINIGFSSCQQDMFVVYNLLILPMTIVPGYIRIEPHSDSGKLVVYECPGDRAELDVSIFNWFGFNAMPGATEETSWGAIKALSRQ